jgi:NMD protein affecting ribosome stability and mRNA decay
MTKIRLCSHCGKEFIGGPWFKVFCSKECRVAYHKWVRVHGARLIEQENGKRKYPKRPIDKIEGSL